MAINSFAGEYRFLSNFYPASVMFEGIIYPSVEHAYQAAKTLDLSQRDQIWSMTAAKAKRFGRKVTLRPDWDEVKIDIMKELLVDKFQHPHLRDWLRATGTEELTEGNWWGDTFWGVCQGKGENMLGKLLMEVRQEL